MIAFEAHHKISRRIRKYGSNFDAGYENALYYLPKDSHGRFYKNEWEPTSLLQYLQYVYGPLLLRISIPNEVFPPTFSISFPKFNHPKYRKESRAKKGM